MAIKVLSVTVDEKVLDSFKKYTESGCINSSQLIEKMIKEHLDKKNKN